MDIVARWEFWLAVWVAVGFALFVKDHGLAKYADFDDRLYAILGALFWPMMLILYPVSWILFLFQSKNGAY